MKVSKLIHLLRHADPEATVVFYDCTTIRERPINSAYEKKNGDGTKRVELTNKLRGTSV